MSNIKGLHDPPRIYKKVKTNIVNGNIVRTDVWMDSMGNELEKRGDKFYFKKFLNHYNHNNMNDFVFTKQKNDSLLDFEKEIIVIMVFFISFLFGLLLGSIFYFVQRRKNIHIDRKNQMKSEYNQVNQSMVN
jgi:uncharacterized membrane protein YciS (DUF1049 family)